MPYTLETAIREILTPSHQLQPFEGTHLTREHFMLEKGVWVRHWRIEPKRFETVIDVPTCKAR